MSDLLKRLQSGDEAAFRELVRAHHMTMVKVAFSAMGSETLAEEVVQETWLAVIRGMATFEGRSTLKTWVFAILMNQARKRLKREGRMVWVEDIEDLRPLDGRFQSDGHWADGPHPWGLNPEQATERRQLMDAIQSAIMQLPDRSRLVVILSDVEGFTGPEISQILDITEQNQRVILHRARAAVRDQIEKSLREASP